MAFDSYLFIQTIKGESQAIIDPKPYGLTDTPIEISSFSFGAENATTIGSASGGAGAGKVHLSNFTIMKKTDNASPVLFQACASGQHYIKASVILRKATGVSGKQGTFLQYDFDTVFVQSINWSGSSGDETPMESVSFVYGKLAITNFVQDTKTGALSKGTGASWDVVKNMP